MRRTSPAELEVAGGKGGAFPFQLQRGALASPSCLQLKRDPEWGLQTYDALGRRVPSSARWAGGEDNQPRHRLLPGRLSLPAAAVG